MEIPGAEPGWDLYRTFLAVVRDGSFSAAARRLGLAQPTAGRHIEALEALLGASLFTRSPRGPVPTAAAREIVGHEVLPTILAGFATRYPHVEIELALSNRNEDLLRRDADVAVRMARPSQKALVARRIGLVRLGLFAHRRYAEAFALPKTPEELAGHRWIGFDRDSSGFPPVDGMQLRREQFGFRCDSGPAQLAAMRAGIGIAGCHVNIARRDPDLIRVLEKPFSFSREMWLLMHRDAKSTRRVRLLFDHLATGLGAYVRAT